MLSNERVAAPERVGGEGTHAHTVLLCHCGLFLCLIKGILHYISLILFSFTKHSDVQE